MIDRTYPNIENPELSAKQVGEMIFEAITASVQRRGGSLQNWPENYPISHRTAYNVKNGEFTAATLKKLPFKVSFQYSSVTISTEK